LKSVMAFHEKAGRSQGNSGFIASFLFFVGEKKFSSPSSRCRRASIRTLEERIVSLGACGAFSIQPVLPSVWRPIVALKSGTWPRPLTQSPELGFGFCLFSSLERFGFCFRFFKRLPQASLGCCCATVHTLLRSPTDDAVTPPAFLPWPQSLASSHFSRRARPVSIPSA